MSQKLQTLLSLIQSDSDIPEDIRFFLLLVEPEVFARFQTDLKKIFEHLIQQYHTEQQKYDFDSYLQGLVVRIQKFNSRRHHQEV